MRIILTVIKHGSHWKLLEIGHLLCLLQELGCFGFSMALIKDTEYAIFKHALIWPSLSYIEFVSLDHLARDAQTVAIETHLLKKPSWCWCVQMGVTRTCSSEERLYEFRLKHTFQACWGMLRTSAAVVCSLEMSESLLSNSLPRSVKVFKACQDLRYIFRCWISFYLLFL